MALVGKLPAAMEKAVPELRTAERSGIEAN